MALNKVNNSIASLIEETALSTVDKLVAFLGEKIEIDEDMRQMFEDFKGTLKAESTEAAKAAKAEAKKTKKSKKSDADASDASDKSDKSDSDGEKKKKRAPSAYNLFIKEKMAELKAQGLKGNLMSQAVAAWNAEKKPEEVPKTPEVSESSDTDAAAAPAPAPEEKKPKKKGGRKAAPVADAEEEQ